MPKFQRLEGEELAVFRASWRGAPIELRLVYLFEDLFVIHPLLDAINQTVIRRGQLRRAGRHGRGFFVSCPADGGKTTLLQFFRHSFAPSGIVEEDPEDPAGRVERRVIPFIAFSVPSPCGTRTMGNAIMNELGLPRRTFPRVEERTPFIIDQLKLAETWFMVIDNMQDVPMKSGPRTTSDVGNMLRDLVDGADIVLVLLGTEEAEIVILANEQLRKRVPGTLALGPYKIDTAKGLGTCMATLAKVERHLPTAERSGIAEGNVGRGLACASNGKIGTALEIIGAALPYMIKDGREFLTVDDLRAGYKAHFLDYADAIDPFDESFVPRRLNKPGEPHFTKLDDANARRRKNRDKP